MQPTLPPSAWMTKAYMNDLNFEKKRLSCMGTCNSIFLKCINVHYFNCEWLRKPIWIDRQEPPAIKELREIVIPSKNCTICFNLYMYIHCTYNHILKQNIQFFLFSFVFFSSFPLIILCFIIFFF